MAKPKTAEKAPAPVTPDGAAAKGKSKLLIAGALAVVLIGGGVGGFLYWQSAHAEPKTAEKPAPPAPMLFVPVEPVFVVNFQGDQSVRFLQLEVQLASRDAATIELIKANDPLIRNDLVMLFAEQSAAGLTTSAGKQKLRADALREVRRIVKSVGGPPESVEAVLFTTFVMQ